ncbi:MAG: choice-of-anchor B family protein [Pricia sp.]
MKNPHFLLLLLSFLFLACSGDDDAPADGKPDIEEMPDTDPEVIATEGFTPCEDGMAGIYPCNGYDFLGRIPLNDFGGNSGNDIWGWTDATTGKEYALMGLDNGTAFIDISDTENLLYLGKLPTAGVSDAWRDVKVYKDHAFIVADNSFDDDAHGMQVFDLTRLRNVADAPVTFDADARYTGLGRAHNIVINEDTGFAYVVGTNRGDVYRGGAHFIDINDPKNPMSAGGYADNGYSHDAQVITYNGPDADYAGREIYIGANESQVIVADVTDKANPIGISTVQYPNTSYTHQGWFTEDQRYFILGDETDEINFGFQSRTLVFDLSDLDNPELHYTYLGPTSAIDHNGYVKGDEYFLANYTAGLRVLDISNIAGRSITESGFFDTYTDSNNPRFDGVWSVYPYFESGKIIVSDINSGLFVIQKSQ